MTKKEERIQVRVTEKFVKRLDKACKLDGLSRSDLIIYAVNKYIIDTERRNMDKPR